VACQTQASRSGPLSAIGLFLFFRGPSRGFVRKRRACGAGGLLGSDSERGLNGTIRRRRVFCEPLANLFEAAKDCFLDLLWRQIGHCVMSLVLRLCVGRNVLREIDGPLVLRYHLVGLPHQIDAQSIGAFECQIVGGLDRVDAKARGCAKSFKGNVVSLCRHDSPRVSVFLEIAHQLFERYGRKARGRDRQRPSHGFGIARDHGEIGARWLIGLGAALLPVA
jgi:hypothetical protein